MHERMPRTVKEEGAEELAAPAKRTRRTPRRRVEAPVEEGAPERVLEVASAEPVRTTRRKAPVRRAVATETPRVETSTTAPGQSTRRPARSYRLVVTAAAFVVALGASAAIGLSDKGTIDVASKIQAQAVATAISEGGDPATQAASIPVQSTPVSVPNAGLRGRGANPAPAQPAPAENEQASSTATSTDAVASSTEATVPAEEEAAPSEIEEPGTDSVVPAG